MNGRATTEPADKPLARGEKPDGTRVAFWLGGDQTSAPLTEGQHVSPVGRKFVKFPGEDAYRRGPEGQIKHGRGPRRSAAFNFSLPIERGDNLGSSLVCRSIDPLHGQLDSPHARHEGTLAEAS